MLLTVHRPFQLDSLQETLSSSKVFTHQARRHIDEMFVALDRRRGPGLGLLSSSSTSPRNLLKALARSDEPWWRAGPAMIGGGMVTRSQQWKTGDGRWARGCECHASEGPWHAEAERQRRKVVLALLDACESYSISIAYSLSSSVPLWSLYLLFFDGLC